MTDANLVLGYINPGYFLGGRMTLRADLAARALRERVAEPLGLGLQDAALAIHRVVSSNMVDLMRFYAVQRGYDPRDFLLFVFGGATGLHACALAEELGVRAAVVPLGGLATVLSAYGIANSDVLRVLSAARPTPFPPPDLGALETVYVGLEEEARRDLAEDGFGAADVALTRVGSMRYHLQLTDVEVELPSGLLDAAGSQEAARRFDERYARLYGEDAGFKEAGRDLIAEFVRARGRTPKASLQIEREGDPDPSFAEKGRRDCFFGGVGHPTGVYDGDKLQPGAIVSGPAVLEMHGTTVVVAPGWCGRYDGLRNVWLEREGR